jgi:glycosyltransferase involved in cell wall biosynthesis
MPCPEFSLILPTYNRAPVLLRVLQHLESLRYPRSGFEVLVADDGSTDGTSQKVASYRAGYDLRLLSLPHRGTGAARNQAIRQARGEFCFFLDDDVFAHPDILLEHREAHRAQPRLLVRGPVVNVPEWPAPPGPLPLGARFSMNYFCTSNASLRRDYLLEAGLFDEDLPRWEDAELGVRLKALGVRRSFRPQAVVYHLKPPPALEQMLNTAAADGRSAALLYRRYPSLRMRLRSGLHPLNYLRCRLLAPAPLLPWYRQAAARGGALGRWARARLAEAEYLRAGRQALAGC